MKTRIVKFGDEYAVIIPKKILKQVGITLDDWVKVEVLEGKIYITKCTPEEIEEVK